MASLRCPHCNQPVAANPLGRWYARFQCPHCRGKLQFDARTNGIGVVGSFFFFAMMYALVMGRTELANALAAGAGALWALSLGLSYALRRIVKG
jgi:phage FluMu protein Com